MGGGGVGGSGGEGAGLGMGVTGGNFGLQHARGTGAEETADAIASVFRNRRIDPIGKAVLLQGQLQQAVITAVKGLQIGPDDGVVDRTHLTQIGVDIDGIKMTGCQAAFATQNGVEGL